MSLLSGLLLDSLLNTVVQQDVWLANRTDSATGAGTELDPFSVPATLPENIPSDWDPSFDQILRALPSHTAIRLMPGLYWTRGFNPSYSNRGWRPASGMRIVGAGVENTTLKLTTSPALPMANLTAVVGNKHTDTSHFLDGFELSDLTVDGSIDTADNAAVGGVALSGRHIFIHRVWVKNFGTKNSQDAYGISVARAHSSTPQTAENCVVENCLVNSPGSNPTAKVIGIHLSSEEEGQFHQFCVVRHCLVDLGQTSGFTWDGEAMAAGGGSARSSSTIDLPMPSSGSGSRIRRRPRT